MKKLNKIKEVLSISLFGIVVLAPSYIAGTISLCLGSGENVAVGIILVALIIHYIVLMKVYGGLLATKIDSLLGTKTLTSTYEITIGEKNDEVSNL
jgi:hypothetical protein